MSSSSKKLTGQVYEFGAFRLDVAERQLLRAGAPVHLTPKVFDLLLALVEDSGRLLEKEELLAKVWPDSYVEEGNINRNISTLRRALNGAGEEFIETVPKRGYRFVAAVKVLTGSGVENEDRAGNSAHAVPAVSRVDSHVPDEPTEAVRNIHAATKVSRVDSRVKWLLIVGVLLIAAGGAIITFKFLRQPTATHSAPNLTFTQLYSLGPTLDAALSPDGNFIAHVLEDKAGQQGLAIKHINSTEVRILVPMTDVDYRGLTFTRDGHFVYYLLNQKGRMRVLYRVPTAGGPALELARLGHASPVSFSPDGRQLAFVREDQATGTSTLLVADADAYSERAVAVKKLHSWFSIDESPAWSPDGRMIACVVGDSTGGVKFRTIGLGVEDGAEVMLSQQVWPWARQLVWLADGSGLLLSARINKGEYAATRLQLWLLSYPEGTVHRITNDLGSYENTLSLSADSRALLTVQANEYTNLWVAPDGDSTRARQITFGKDKLDGIYGLSWTPDGRIVYTSVASGQQQIWVMNPDGSDARQLTKEGINVMPHVTRDGRYILYSSDHDEGTRVWRMNADGNNPVMITDGFLDFDPQCSPDGKWVFFSSERSGKRTLWKVGVDGGAAIQVTDNAAEYPAIAPHGELLACAHQLPGTPRSLALVNYSGALQKILNVASPSWPAPRLQWSADGATLFLSLAKQRVSNIYSLPAQGGSLKQLTHFDSDFIFSFAWSQDMKLLAYARGNDEYRLVLLSGFR